MFDFKKVHFTNVKKNFSKINKNWTKNCQNFGWVFLTVSQPLIFYFLMISKKYIFTTLDEFFFSSKIYFWLSNFFKGTCVSLFFENLFDIKGTYWWEDFMFWLVFLRGHLLRNDLTLITKNQINEVTTIKKWISSNKCLWTKSFRWNVQPGFCYSYEILRVKLVRSSKIIFVCWHL